MPDSEYCNERDLYECGLPSSLPNPARRIASADPDTDVVTLDAHGFYSGLAVSFRAEGDAILPAPLAKNTTYYVANESDNTFQVSLTAGGAAVDITAAGGDTLVISSIPYAGAIRWASALINEMLPAHVVPLSDPVPTIVRVTVAELATWKLYNRHGAGSKSLTELIDDARKRLDRWAKGVPILSGGDNPPGRAQLSAVSSATARCADSRGWGRFGGP